MKFQSDSAHGFGVHWTDLPATDLKKNVNERIEETVPHPFWFVFKNFHIGINSVSETEKKET